MILVDTSVWIDHLRRGDERLGRVLLAGRVLMHPFIVGELACGNLRNRVAVLELLDRLPAAPTASEAEARAFLERHALMGRGVGHVDVHLLASAALAGNTRLWSRDRPLARVAVSLGLDFDPAAIEL